METKLQSCRICKELEASHQAAQQPDPPALVLGLTEAGRRNRDHQRQELLERIENLRESIEDPAGRREGISARSRTNGFQISSVITHDNEYSRR